MMQDDELLAVELELRHLIAREAFDRAGAALALYCEELNRRLTSLPAGSVEQRELARTCGDFLSWVGVMVRTSQSHFCDELHQISQVSGYRNSDMPPGLQLQA